MCIKQPTLRPHTHSHNHMAFSQICSQAFDQGNPYQNIYMTSHMLNAEIVHPSHRANYIWKNA